MAKAEITVSVERAAHAAFEELAQHIWDQHKIRIDSVSFDWFEVPGADGTQNVVQGAFIKSKSYRSER